jgi:hypothetical protein
MRWAWNFIGLLLRKLFGRIRFCFPSNTLKQYVPASFGTHFGDAGQFPILLAAIGLGLHGVGAEPINHAALGIAVRW